MLERIHLAVLREVDRLVRRACRPEPGPKRQAKKSPLRERAESIFLEEDRGDKHMMPRRSI